MTQIPEGAAPTQRARGIGGYAKAFLELVKFEHSVFALPYAYIGAIYGAMAVTLYAFAPFLGARPPHAANAAPLLPTTSAQTPWVTASGWPSWAALLWITVAMVGARAVAFAVNRAVDKEIDARNPRTATRAIPAGVIKAWELWLFAALMAAAYLFAVFQLAPITHWLWPIPLAAFLIYPYLKRFTPLAHYWLGLCLGLGCIGGWLAVGASVSAWQPWAFSAAVAFWTAGFDMIYATQDYECDVRDGIHSMPADFGIGPALLQCRVDHALTIVLFLLGGWGVGATWPYYLGVGIAAALLVYENVIVSEKDLSRVNAAFFLVNGCIAIIILVGVVAGRLVVQG
jgi:4-hydroxybenzoate polyprenyltransferase